MNITHAGIQVYSICKIMVPMDEPMKEIVFTRRVWRYQSGNQRR